ncbi:MAG TPA: DUF3040 domain-containing protein [Streptosporangiaceae bacterium]|jgi:hypothetical protein|nr:DUF3040 domain-containing protein [Streptosporangiaceae bacterium]
MALSMDEQRILDEIERRLAGADPGLASRLASFSSNRGGLALRVRRARLIASFVTLLIVAMVSLVVYALVPFRAATTSPPHHPLTSRTHPPAKASASAKTLDNDSTASASPPAAAVPSAGPPHKAGAPAQPSHGTARQ